MAFKHNDSCYHKAADDEPIFTLRAQDVLAPSVIEIWCVMAESKGCKPEKIAEARQVARAMKEWENRKLPD